MRKPVSRSPAVTGRCGQPGRPRMATAEGGASRSGCEHNDSHGQAHLLLCVLCQTPLPRTHRRRDRSRAPTRDGREQGGEEGTTRIDSPYFLRFSRPSYTIKYRFTLYRTSTSPPRLRVEQPLADSSYICAVAGLVGAQRQQAGTACIGPRRKGDVAVGTVALDRS